MSGEEIPVSALEDDALPSLDGSLPEGMPVGEAQDRQHSPRDRALGSTGWGTTAREERDGEPLDLKLAREEPEAGVDDVDPYPADAAGRLVDPDEGTSPDVDAELVGHDVGRDRGARSAEEAAMRVTSDVPGGSWAPSSGYLPAEETGEG